MASFVSLLFAVVFAMFGSQNFEVTTNTPPFNDDAYCIASTLFDELPDLLTHNSLNSESEPDKIMCKATCK